VLAVSGNGWWKTAQASGDAVDGGCSLWSHAARHKAVFYFSSSSNSVFFVLVLFPFCRLDPCPRLHRFSSFSSSSSSSSSLHPRPRPHPRYTFVLVSTSLVTRCSIRPRAAGHNPRPAHAYLSTDTPHRRPPTSSSTSITTSGSSRTWTRPSRRLVRVSGEWGLCECLRGEARSAKCSPMPNEAQT
jgi:hypothetical protein